MQKPALYVPKGKDGKSGACLLWRTMTNDQKPAEAISTKSPQISGWNPKGPAVNFTQVRFQPILGTFDDARSPNMHHMLLPPSSECTELCGMQWYADMARYELRTDLPGLIMTSAEERERTCCCAGSSIPRF